MKKYPKEAFVFELFNGKPGRPYLVEFVGWSCFDHCIIVEHVHDNSLHFTADKNALRPLTPAAKRVHAALAA
jgi:hypothetical protein